MGSKVQVIPNGVTLQEFMAGKSSTSAMDAEGMTSADYYADSYGHFGIHGTGTTKDVTNGCRGNVERYCTDVVLSKCNLSKFTHLCKQGCIGCWLWNRDFEHVLC